MEVEVGKENICINKLVCEKKEVIFALNPIYHHELGKLLRSFEWTKQ